METPSLDRCLAYVALSDYRSWIGHPSPWGLALLLAGASERAYLTSTRVEEWRIYGPLQDPTFYMPIVARTGHPDLSIKWATALEFLHLDLEAAIRELITLLENWSGSLPARSVQPNPLTVEANQPPPTLHQILRQLARRPVIFLGSSDGWGLRCYLHGMLAGGDWLGLPALDGLREVIMKIESASFEAYGSSFAGYRAYRDDCRPLLSWAGIEP